MQSAESAGREPSYIAQEHGHRISFRAHSAGNYKTASLNEQSGKYAKYWLLNAKDTNGNGWGIAAHTAKDNMKKFIGRPLVVTASSWHGASEYGDQYEHPYLPTNDITAILDHQEKFRVGSIVDVVEDSHGDWYANVEMLPKFANSRLPPFCSPAIYQLDASEAEGQISKWEALHLAALTENPAYGARIALLKGTCVGTGSECKVQFKSAKQLVAESPCHDNYEMIGTKSKDGRKVPNCVPSKQAKTVCPKKKQKISRLKQRLSSEDPTEKVIREVKDPEKKKDLLNRLDEKPNEYGPKNYGATKPKNFGKKIGKLKQRLAGDNWSAVEDDDFFTKPYKAPPIEYSKEYGFSAMDHISNLHDEASYNAGQNAMKKFEGLSHPLSKKFAFEAMDNHLYNSSLMIQNNYPDIEDIVGNNDKDSLYNILEGHSADTLEHANYRIEDKFGFGEESPQPQNEGEELGRALFEPFERMKDEEYAQIPDRKGDMLKTKDIINEYTNDVSGGIMKSFGKYTKHPLQAKLKISKLKQRLAAVGLKNVDENPLGRRQKTVGTPAEVRQAFVEGRSLRSGNRMEDGVRTADAHQTDGENLFLFGNKILTKDGKGGYITNAKEWMGKGYKNATLKEYRALGIPVDTKGIIDPSRKYYSPDGKLLKTKGLEGNLNKEDITISKEQLYEGEVRLGDSTKAKPKVVDPNARRPLDNRHNLREFASSSRKRLTGDASATRTPPYSETATQPEDAMLSNELLGFSKSHGLEKTFGKKTKTDSVFNLGIKGEYSKVPGPDTHHIGYKKLFRRPTGINPTSDLKHYRNTKTSPPGNKHQPFFNRGNNAIQLNTDEHTGGEQYAPQGLPSTRGTDRHSVHSLNPHENFKSILHSKLKARLANLGEQNMTYQDSKKVKIHKKKNMEKHDKS